MLRAKLAMAVQMHADVTEAHQRGEAQVAELQANIGVLQGVKKEAREQMAAQRTQESLLKALLSKDGVWHALTRRCVSSGKRQILQGCPRGW